MAKRKRHSPEFKFKSVIEVLKGEKTAAQLAGELEVHPMVLSEWKKRFLENGADFFKKPNKGNRTSLDESGVSELYEQIGRLKMEIEWYKKKLGTFQ